MGKISKVAFGFVEDPQEDIALQRRMKLLSFITPEVWLDAFRAVSNSGFLLCASVLCLLHLFSVR